MNKEEYLKGTKLIGDDYSLAEIEAWYNDETEAYANLGSKEKSQYSYDYHNMNIVNGFSKLKHVTQYEKVLGIGAAYGNEFQPVSDKIKELHILEPSDNLISKEIFGLHPIYQKPTISGAINYPDNTFDLITCFGVLHHIPNVSYVLSELYRVLKPGGTLLLREPVISMGDWETKRQGLTARERGIPKQLFKEIILRAGFEIKSSNYCFFLSSLLQRKLGNLLKKPIYSYMPYVYLDKFFSRLLSWNTRYHATTMLERISPSNIFYVLQKK